jgi:probable HAF family extracellular repeat protein
LIFMAGCSDRADSPTVVEVQFAKGGGGTSVDAADPSSAPQDITLDVRVIGSGFDDGSVVRFLKGGQSSPKIVTNSSTFIDRNNVVANITIAVDAEVTLYDIELTTSRGKKGMGSELFSVKTKGDTEPEFVITTTDLGTLAGSSSATARSVISGPDGSSVRVVGASGDRASYWTPGGGFVELVIAPPSDPDATVLDIQANDINDPGQVVGERYVRHSDLEVVGQPIFWSSSAASGIVLPTQQARFVFTTGINNVGQVAGWASGHPQHPDQSHAMLWTVDGVGSATVRDLYEDFTALGFSQSIAEGINEGGQVVGWAFDGSRERAFLWEDGTVTLLDGEVEPGFQSFAYAVNNADPVQIVGGSHDPSGGSRRALLWTILPDGTVVTEELPPPAGFEWSWPTDLNDIGEAVGGSRPQSGQDDHATLWTFAPNTGDRVVVDLGMGGAGGIDNSAWLVGLTRVVGTTTIEVGKGRKKTRNPRAILWEVEPPGS